MKFKGTLGTQFSGSLAGVTASHNSGGAYLRQRAVPVQPNSTAQQLVKTYFAALAASWSASLTAPQRAAWETYGLNTPIPNVLGEQILIPGRTWYIGNNVARLRAGLSPVAAGPTTFGLPELTAPSVVATATPDLEVTFDNGDLWATVAGGALALQVSIQQPPAVNFFKGPFRFLGKVAGAGTPPTSPQTFTTGFPSALTAANVLFVRLRALTADGRASAPLILRTEIEA